MKFDDLTVYTEDEELSEIHFKLNDILCKEIYVKLTLTYLFSILLDISPGKFCFKKRESEIHLHINFDIEIIIVIILIFYTVLKYYV